MIVRLTVAFLLVLAVLTCYAVAPGPILFVIATMGLLSIADGVAFHFIHDAAKANSSLAKYSVFFGLGAVGMWVAAMGAITLLESTTIAAFVCCVIALIDLAVVAAQKIVLGTHKKASDRARRWVGISAAFTTLMLLIALAPALGAVHLIHQNPTTHPSQAGYECKDVSFEADDGTRLRGWYMPVEEARGTVVFCHGHGQHRGQVVGVIEPLRRLKFNVLAFDFRGHGMSEGRSATFGIHERNDLISAVAFAQQQAPDKPIYIVGISYGAAVTLQTLPALPQVRAVWVEASFARFTNVADQKFATLPNNLRAPLLNTYYQLTALDSGFQPQAVNPIDHLQNIRVPIMFVHGKKDELIPFSEAEALYSTYDGPKEKLWFNGGTHYNLLPQWGDHYRAAMHDFFVKHRDSE